MKERPIIFSGPMVRAILAGTKTQTRRVVHPDCVLASDYDIRANFRSRYGVSGDLLWVREAWREAGSFMSDKRETPAQMVERLGLEPDECVFAADDPCGGPWRPAIFMPRAVSRITLEITDVRVQRLWDIDENDAIAEGAAFHDGLGVGHSGWRHDLKDVFDSARNSFAYQWGRINEKRSPWSSNPWVWAITFKVVA